MRITKRRLRKIIKEEKRKLLKEFSYSEKLQLLMTALHYLEEAQRYEEKHSEIDDHDPDLDAIVDDLLDYVHAVKAMVSQFDDIAKGTPMTVSSNEVTGKQITRRFKSRS